MQKHIVNIHTSKKETKPKLNKINGEKYPPAKSRGSLLCSAELLDHSRENIQQTGSIAKFRFNFSHRSQAEPNYEDAADTSTRLETLWF